MTTKGKYSKGKGEFKNPGELPMLKTYRRISRSPSVLGMVNNDAELVKLVSEGKLTRVMDICNAHPELLLRKDDKGATLLHHAAAKSQIKMMEYIISNEGRGLLNETDEMNATSLHWAVKHDQPKSADWLLSRGADAKIRNKSGETPLHSCVRSNSLDTLQILLKYKGLIDLEERLKSGATALHLAADADNAEAAKLLLEAGAQGSSTCNQGYTPLHRAAVHGSEQILLLFLGQCEQFGFTREQALSVNDREQCSPLHCAVSGGNSKAIEMCLKYGARLDSQQKDLSTPMHLVCAQGVHESVLTMFSLAPEQAKTTLFILDKQKQAPLHKAAIFGHVEVLKYIIGKGAELDVPDINRNTPLLLAASRANWECVRALIANGAQLCVKNEHSRNLMHMIVMSGGDIRDLDVSGLENLCQSPNSKSSFKSVFIHDMLHQADSCGCTPLHYACQEGNLASLDTLIYLGVSSRLKSNSNQSPLHFAAMFGRYNTCVKLMKSSQGVNIINDKDDEGMTPLHFAAKNGHTKIVQLLINQGSMFQRNAKGETVLHVAAAEGYTRTIMILLSINRALLNEVDREGVSATMMLEVQFLFLSNPLNLAEHSITSRWKIQESERSYAVIGPSGFYSPQRDWTYIFHRSDQTPPSRSSFGSS